MWSKPHSLANPPNNFMQRSAMSRWTWEASDLVAGCFGSAHMYGAVAENTSM